MKDYVKIYTELTVYYVYRSALEHYGKSDSKSINLLAISDFAVETCSTPSRDFYYKMIKNRYTSERLYFNSIGEVDKYIDKGVDYERS